MDSSDVLVGVVGDFDPVSQHKPPLAHAFGRHFSRHICRVLKSDRSVGVMGALLIEDSFIVEEMEEIFGHKLRTPVPAQSFRPCALATSFLQSLGLADTTVLAAWIPQRAQPAAGVTVLINRRWGLITCNSRPGSAR